MKRITLFAVLLMTTMFVYGQNLIGCKVFEIQKYMKEKYQDMSPEKIVNTRYNYLKYSDSGGSQTLLFFLDQDSVCKSERMICDFSMKTEKVKEYNSIYKMNGDNKWVDKRDGKEYLIEIRDEQWSCVIIIEPAK